MVGKFGLRSPTQTSRTGESGAEDARTPTADASSADLAGAKRLECVRFIGAFRPARDGQRFMVPMHGIKVVEAFHERGSAVLERNRSRADQVHASVDRGHFNRRAALAEFAVKILPYWEMLFRLEGEVA